MTESQYNLLLNTQGDGCALCGAADPRSDRVLFDIDHSHHCPHAPGRSCLKCWRGLLCHVCNVRFEHNVGNAYINEVEGCANEFDLRILNYLRNPPAEVLRTGIEPV